MKTAIITLLLFISCSITTIAQKGQPAFGKIDKADLEMKDCDFDKGAEALVLIDYGNTYYDRGTEGYSLFKTVYERRTRIKILKEKGIEQANIEIPYYTHNNEERILRLKAKTYNLDETGKVISTDVKKSSIYSKKIDAYYSKMIIAFPEVKPGSVIEYSYAMERETMSQLRNWYFQGRIPVRYSEYQLTIPQIFVFSEQSMTIDPIERKQEVVQDLITSSQGVVETNSFKKDYIMQNLVGIKDEPYMGAAVDYMQRLEFNLSQVAYSENNVIDISLKWKDVIKNLKEDEDFGLQLQKNVQGASGLIEESAKYTNKEEKMKFLYNRIREQIIWNGDYDVYTDNGINKTWESKTGNSADINLLLINILNKAGIKVTPILFSTRLNGLVSSGYPTIKQFNAVMAYVEAENKSFILDATDKYINYNLVPAAVVNTQGLLLKGEEGMWKEILNGKYKYKVMAAVQAEIDANGNMKGNGLVNCYDYARLQRCKSYFSDKQKFKENYFIKPYQSLSIDDITINNTDADSLPLEQKINFNSKLNSSGAYQYFSINLFSDLETNPFLAEKRVSDIDYGVPQTYNIFGNYTIPQGYVFDGLPQNINLTTPDKSIVFTRILKTEANLLNVHITVEFKRSFYLASTYPDFKEFYKKMFDKLNEQVVIKKSSKP